VKVQFNVLLSMFFSIVDIATHSLSHAPCCFLVSLSPVSKDTYTIDYLHDTLLKDKVGALLGSLTHGPFYLWLDPSTPVSVDESQINAARLVLKAYTAHWPLHSAYGISKGNLVAALAANGASITKFQSWVCASMSSMPEYLTATPLPERDGF
jgi:hypothetical protein